MELDGRYVTMIMIKGKKILYIILGIVAITLGAIGLFVPGIPTTPFVLLALWSFSRSWTSMHKKLEKNKLINRYVNKRSGTLKSKVLAIAFMVLMVSFSIYIHWENNTILSILIPMAIIGLIFMITHIKVNKS